MRELEILSRDNPKIKLYCKLRDKRSARDKEGLFVLEGARIIADAVKERIPLKAAFYTSDAAAKYSDTVAALCDILGDNAYLISQEVSAKLGDTASPQGIFAVSERLDKTPPLDKIVSGKFLILNDLQDPGNIGTILRAADAVGISGVYLCGGCDIYNPKLVRSTMGSLFRVPVCDRLSYAEVISLFKNSSVKTYAAVVDKDADSLQEFSFPDSCAVVIGNEGNGISQADANLCDGKITIKMCGNIESLNAASAATIFLWELMKGE